MSIQRLSCISLSVLTMGMTLGSAKAADPIDTAAIMAQGGQDARWLRNQLSSSRDMKVKSDGVSQTLAKKEDMRISGWISGAHTTMRNPSPIYRSKGTKEMGAVGLDASFQQFLKAGVGYYFSDSDVKAYSFGGKLLTKQHTIAPFVALYPVEYLSFHLRGGLSHSRTKVKTPTTFGRSNVDGRFINFDATVQKRIEAFEPSVRLGIMHYFSKAHAYTLASGQRIGQTKLETQSLELSFRNKFYVTESFVPYVTVGVDPLLQKSKVLKAKFWNGYRVGGGANLFRVGNVLGGADYQFARSAFNYRSHTISATLRMRF